jgi:hypothetical protein
MLDWSAEQLSSGGGAAQDSVLLALLTGAAEAQGVVLLVAAAVARSGVQAEDQQAKRESKPKRETRARGLLAAALSKELRELGAGLAALVGRPLRLVDLVLPESQRGLRELLLARLRRAEFARLPAIEAEAEEWLARFAGQRVRSAALPLFDSELEWTVAQPERLPMGVLAPWLPVCPLAPAAGPVGVEGEGAALRVVCSRPDWRRLVLSVPAAQGAPLELLLSVMMVGRPAAEDADSRELAAVIAAQAQELSERIQEAAEAVPPEEWLAFSLTEDQRALCWLARLAQALWRESVLARWDLGERKRRPKPVPAGPVEDLGVFLSASGKPELLADSGVRLLTAEGDAVEDQQVLEAKVGNRELAAQSHLGVRLYQWLARDARVLGGGDGAEVKIRGGWTELAALVLGVDAAAVNKRDVTELRSVTLDLQRLRQIPWADKTLLDCWLLMTAERRAAEDARVVELVITVGPWARWDLVPEVNSVPSGRRRVVRALEIPPPEVAPELVLGPRNTAPELCLPAALSRLFDDKVKQYPKGVRVTEADLVKLLQRFGLRPEHAPLLREEWLTAKKERELTGRADLPPLLHVTESGGWQWNRERWPEGHEWHLRRNAAVLGAKPLPGPAPAGKGAKGKKGKPPPQR